ncbi:MAG: FAD-dependent oxidoreductase [Solirubrobacterales bacterium]|nr:FAD-dependent oxidoreductase [Solirubrobacterales bacterium]
MRLVIVGGSDAGISAGLRAREVDQDVRITVLVADDYPNFSICGLPYFLSGEVADWRSLAHRTRQEIAAHGIHLRLNTPARRLDVARRVVVTDHDELAYDRLVVATGAEPSRPPIAGIELRGVHVLRSMADAFAVQTLLLEREPRSALIVGAGYIGCEMADAFRLRGLKVTVVEQAGTVLPGFDAEIGRLAQSELERHGVHVVVDTAVRTIGRGRRGLSVETSAGTPVQAELVLVVVGVRPNTALAADAGAATGERGALRVSRELGTNLPNVWAAGDCVETWHRQLERPTYLPLGTTAHKQGRAAGENAVGGHRQVAGTLGTQVLKVFELAVAGTGLRDHGAREAGFDPLTMQALIPDHKRYYPGAHALTVRVTGDRRTGRLLGAQIGGHRQGEVAKRIDTYATALHHGLSVDAMSDLDLSYTPPFAAPWDPVQAAAQVWTASAGRDRPRIMEPA